MNAADVLKYGQLTLLASIDRIPDDRRDITGVCGVWSLKDLVSHLVSYEIVLVELLSSFIEPGVQTANLDKFTKLDGEEFNQQEVGIRAKLSFQEVFNELTNSHTGVMQIITQIKPETFVQPGTLPWYGLEYSLDDFLVYSYYGHKREHSAQIDAFG
jgi:hypothetical protein